MLTIPLRWTWAPRTRETSASMTTPAVLEDLDVLLSPVCSESCGLIHEMVTMEAASARSLHQNLHVGTYQSPLRLRPAPTTRRSLLTAP